MNLYNGAADPDELESVLITARPDVVAVQELSKNSARVLSDWSASSLLDARDDTLGMGMASQIPVETTRLEFPNRNPILGRFDGAFWGLPAVEVINAHITNPISTPLGHSRRMRVAETAALESLLDNGDDHVARILVGDFNSSPAWPLYRRVAAKAIDGAVQAGTARRTWGYYPNSPRMLRIDHVFLQGPIKCTGTQLVKISGADHRGLLIDLEPRAAGG
jgi:endonuclease/exonuclease/phosphatase family metal-dependent hydrolase